MKTYVRLFSLKVLNCPAQLTALSISYKNDNYTGPPRLYRHSEDKEVQQFHEKGLTRIHTDTDFKEDFY